MNNEKLENLLNLALNTSLEEREKTQELNIGYEAEEKLWTLIVKHTGTLKDLEPLGISYTLLYDGYAILKVPENLIDAIASLDEIQYVEKPKRLFFQTEFGKSISCINSVQEIGRIPYLTGEGVLVAVIDSGIDIFHPDFITDRNTSRILYLWDQTVEGNPPEGYFLGSEVDNGELNEIIEKRGEASSSPILSVVGADFSRHGTMVAGVAAGNGRASMGRYKGVAYNAELIVVKLGIPGENSFPRTSELMMGINYCVQKGVELNRPVAINISFGNTYGSHSGDSLLETFINSVADIGKTSIAIGSGNEGSARGHAKGRISSFSETNVELAVAEYESILSIQIWKYFSDEIEIMLISPSGMSTVIINSANNIYRTMLGSTEILAYYGEPLPYSLFQEIYIELIPGEFYIESGIWRIRLNAKEVVVGEYDMWLPSMAVLSGDTGFLIPSVETTLTIPSTSVKAITVGAYDGRRDSVAGFSGKGYTRVTNQVKPDLVAPGVDVICPIPGGSYGVLSGTSIATPFVTGSAALLMEWGIVDGNDIYLFGEKLKAYLISGARKLPGYDYFPNENTGWGALCLKDSIK